LDQAIKPVNLTAVSTLINQGFRKILLLFLSVSLLITAWPLKAALAVNESSALETAKYLAPIKDIESSVGAAILINAKSGQVIYSFQPDQPLPMASTTKIMTALLTLEHASLAEPVAISENAVRVDGTRIYLEPGEIQTVENLLYASLLNSANDSAAALGEHLGQGSLENFALLMNQRAAEIGMPNTHFSNPTGLTEENHYSSARDIANLSRVAMQNPKFREMVSTQTRPWYGEKYESNLINLNRLLWTYPGATGVKTGYTRAAKNCLVAAADRDGQELIAVILGSCGDIWAQTATLLDYGFEQFTPAVLVNQGQIITNLDLTKERQVPLLASRSLQVSLPRGRTIEPLSQISLAEDIKPPLTAGTSIGQLTYEIEGQPLEPIPLVLAEDIPPESMSWLVKTSLAFAGGLIFVLYLIWRLNRQRRSVNYRRSSRRKRVPYKRSYPYEPLAYSPKDRQ
jgi:D-alanyl-D-alanine carboxypeptidase (penicillin-binding protein 5/6)